MHWNFGSWAIKKMGQYLSTISEPLGHLTLQSAGMCGVYRYASYTCRHTCMCILYTFTIIYTYTHTYMYMIVHVFMYLCIYQRCRRSPRRIFPQMWFNTHRTVAHHSRLAACNLPGKDGQILTQLTHHCYLIMFTKSQSRKQIPKYLRFNMI